jgi:hypothetical protein
MKWEAALRLKVIVNDRDKASGWKGLAQPPPIMSKVDDCIRRTV